MSKILVSVEELKKRQSLPLFDKIKWLIERYIDFVEVYGVNGVYLGFSGGKDSQVLKDAIDRLHAGEMMEYLDKEYLFLYNKLIKETPPPRSAFCDTGLEFPEIRKNVKKFDNVDWLKPEMLWVDVVVRHGFLIGGKKVSRSVSDLRNPTSTNVASRSLYLTGIKRDGTVSKTFKLAKQWLKLIDAPFNVSNKCCDIFKKNPFKAYEKLTGRKPISGTTAAESEMRRISYMATGCNSFGSKAISRPLSIWTEQDVWDYAKLMNIRFAEVYYSREVDFLENDGSLKKVMVDGERQTGCMFCLVGQPKHIKERMDRLEITHNKQYRFLMDGKVNMRSVLEYLGIRKQSKQINLFD